MKKAVILIIRLHARAAAKEITALTGVIITSRHYGTLITGARSSMRTLEEDKILFRQTYNT